MNSDTPGGIPYLQRIRLPHFGEIAYGIGLRSYWRLHVLDAMYRDDPAKLTLLRDLLPEFDQLVDELNRGLR